MPANAPEYPQLFTRAAEGHHLAVNSLGSLQDGTSLPLYFATGQGGQFTLNADIANIDHKRWEILLEDLSTGQLTDLTARGYTFEAGTTPADARFRLHFNLKSTTNTVAAEETGTVSVYGFDEKAYIRLNSTQQAQVSIFDMAGNRIVHQDIQGDASFRIGRTGIFLVKVVAGKQIQTRKIFIRSN